MFAIARRTSLGSQVGWASSASAATPLTCGVAMEVPESATPRLPVPMAVEMTLTPGAVTSGLRCESRLRGPPDEKPAKAWNPGFGMPVAVESVPEAADDRLTRSLPSTPRKGIVTPAMPPSNGG